MNELGIAPASSQGELVMSLPGIKMVIDSSKVCFTNPFLRFLSLLCLRLFSPPRNAHRRILAQRHLCSPIGSLTHNFFSTRASLPATFPFFPFSTSPQAGLLIGKAGVTITDIRMQSRARVLLLDEEQSAKDGAVRQKELKITKHKHNIDQFPFRPDTLCPLPLFTG